MPSGEWAVGYFTSVGAGGHESYPYFTRLFILTLATQTDTAKLYTLGEKTRNGCYPEPR